MKIKAKEPWLAVFLNRLLPGLGYLYTKNLVRAIIVFLVTISLTFIAVSTLIAFAKNDTTVTSKVLWGVIIFVAVNFIFNFAILIDGYLCARKHNLSNDVKPSRMGLRIFAIIGTIVLLLTGGISIFPVIYIRTHLIQFFKMPTTSMAPALKLNDKIMVDKKAYNSNKPQRMEIVVFLPPHDNRKYYLKRIIGLPGEEVEIKDGKVYINNEVITNLFVTNNYYYNQGDYAKKGKKIIVPPNNYYVLGDNSVSSLDSRFFGFVPEKNITGKVVKIYWPPERSGRVK
ncbi:MAG: signal peptidase I [Candidatus Omnitrophica bacterium]|nr:signal peptidase I [Candidatus Omnitrophota bacterium]